MILLELPYRPLGGQLPEWNELLAIKSWAQENGVPMHMDGARIWQCLPFYGKTYAQIAGLFDSVYVSFYKVLGGLGGAMLIGDRDFIEEAKLWRIRHGGRLFTMGPYLVSAKMGMERVLPQIDKWVGKARELAAIFTDFDRIIIKPTPPHVNMFQLYFRGEAETVKKTAYGIGQGNRDVLVLWIKGNRNPWNLWNRDPLPGKFYGV